MTTDELIPILKALHADPCCAPQLADWFEERDDLPTAEVLRWGKFDSGTQLIRTLVWGNRFYTKPDSPQSVYRVVRNHCIQSAVIEEAMSRVENPDEVDTRHMNSDLRFHRDAITLRGTREPWTRIPHHPSWSWDRGHPYTCVSPDGEKATRIMMRLVRLKWEPPLVTLCGGWLELTMCVWVGIDPFTGRPLVTHFDKSLARDPVLKEMPF